MQSSSNAVEASGTFTIGDLTIHRLGFGAMRITGPGVSRRRRQGALERLLERVAVRLREAIKSEGGAGGAAPGGGPLQG